MKDKKDIEYDILAKFLETTILPYINNLTDFNTNQIKSLDESIAVCQDMIKQYEAQKLDTEAKLLELSKSELYINQIIKILKQSK